MATRKILPVILEPPPMFQAMTQYAVEPSLHLDYVNDSQVDEYSQDGSTGEASPIFAYAPRSPNRETVLPGSFHTSTPARNHNRVRKLDSNDEGIVPSIRGEPVTPLQPARKHTAKSGPRLDPDEEPVWSTLPPRSKRTK
ncbi:hypothetical protein FRC08_016554 [Ceratobasidium sp. 394]|nr:hypothetical protein FRC08_016554 [Ceratobasidium sp. 394]KAG9085255.1 hypothetical protein FS749_004584 [Ceratobasidium sp. UAMH 11750]